MSFTLPLRASISFSEPGAKPASAKLVCDHCKIDFTPDPKKARACIRVRCPIRRLLPK